jgi:hypothetical protein
MSDPKDKDAPMEVTLRILARKREDVRPTFEGNIVDAPIDLIAPLEGEDADDDAQASWFTLTFDPGDDLRLRFDGSRLRIDCNVCRDAGRDRCVHGTDHAKNKAPDDGQSDD